MADATFLAYVEDIHQCYCPLPGDFTMARWELLKEAMIEIGNRPDYRTGHARRIEERLRYISMSALDMMRSDDYDRLFAKIVDLHTKKNAGYAGLRTADPWANFRMSEWFHVSPFVGCLIRMSDKLIRLKNLYEDPKADQVGENIQDTLYDLAIYSVIAICLLKEEVSGVGKFIITQ